MNIKKLRGYALLIIGFKTLGSQAAPVLPDVQPNIPRPVSRERAPVITPSLDLPETTNAVSKLPKIRINVSAFNFKGNTKFSNLQLSAELKEFTNREIGIKELNLALRKIQDLYRSEGYLLAQAYLPVQDIRKTSESAITVEIAILEGVLGKVTIDAPESINHAFFDALAQYQLKQGAPLIEKNLIRNLTVINDLPGATMFSQLNPGAEVGSSDVAISVQPRETANYVLFANTFGNPFTGREQLGVAAIYNNLGGRGDQLSLLARGSINNGQNLLSALYVTPVHESGTLLNLSYSFIEYTLGKQFKNLGARGDSNYFAAYVDQPLVRDTVKGVYGRAGLNYKILDDEIRLAGLNNRRDVRSFEFGLTGDWVSATNDVIYQWSATLTTGDVSFKDSSAKLLDSIGVNSQGGFVKWNLTSSRSQFFENGLNWVIRADYQGSKDNLDIVEKLGIGAINRWRQFSEFPSFADQGYMIGTDLKRTWAISSENPAQIFRQLTPFAFFDHGRGRINHDAISQDNHVTSNHIGVGLDLQIINKWNFGMTLSQQKRDLDGVAREQETRLWGQLRKEF